jgi:hypothetical protein
MGLPFPKELAPLGPGRFLIDSCLDLVERFREDKRILSSDGIRILLLDNGLRGQTDAHIRERFPDISLARVRQRPDNMDMTTAVMELVPWFSEVNILLLPDAIYESRENPLSPLVTEVLARSFAFGAVRTDHPENLGALLTEGDRCREFQDKPGMPGAFNAAWTMLGFSPDLYGTTMLDIIRRSALKITSGPVSFQCGVVWIDGYRDCGTWENYLTELRKSE